jgi:hypothetical protein
MSKPTTKRWRALTQEILMLKKKFGNEYPHREFPDLSVPKRGTPVTNGMSGSTASKKPIPGRKEFPIGNLHKSGLQMITPGEDARSFNGSKVPPSPKPHKPGTTSGFEILNEIRKRESY